MKNKTKLAMIGYGLMAALTYGYASNDSLKFNAAHFPHLTAMNEHEAVGDGLICAVVWPVYWPFHVSRQLWGGADGKAQKGTEETEVGKL